MELKNVVKLKSIHFYFVLIDTTMAGNCNVENTAKGENFNMGQIPFTSWICGF